MANSAVKQIETFSLILLRQTFTDFSAVHETVDCPQVGRAVPHALADANGASAIFVALKRPTACSTNFRSRPIAANAEASSSPRM